MLWLRGCCFSILIPGSVGYFIPQIFIHTRAAGGWYRLGWILFGMGAVIYLRCLLDFLRAGGTPSIFFTRPLRHLLGQEPDQVVRGGLYRYSRNPMYVGVFLFIAGQAIIWKSRSVGLYLLIAILAFHGVVVFVEEPHLARTRGPSYAEYRRRTPRWLGLPR